jgi:hypothetical protein
MENITSRFFLFIGFLLAAILNPGFFAYGQLACNPGEPVEVDQAWVNRPMNAWTGYVFQIDPGYRPQDDYSRKFIVPAAQANRVFKGYLLRDGNHFLPTAELNFYTEFSSIPNNGLGEDLDFFPTGTDPSTPGGCDTQLSDFGVLMKSKTTIQEPGIYRLTIGSDDGSYLSVYQAWDHTKVFKDVNGNDMTHDNWYKDGSDGYFNFIYGDNIRNYYLPFNGGENVWFDLNYYERKGNNRLSFNFELYFGPGEIGIPTNSNPGPNDYIETGIASYCGIAPDPMVLKSRGPAQFAEGTDPTYQWQYSLVNDNEASNWTDIPGATSLDYDIPQYDINGSDENNWTGTRYYRRMAYNTAANPEGEIITNEFASNVLEISVSVIEDLDQNEYGENEWIGHIYNHIRNFDSQDYLGRYKETETFSQNFGEPNWGIGNQNTFTPDHGCTFSTELFTISYKMRLTVEPGTYRFKVNGDDGYRLSINGIEVIDEWDKLSGVKANDDTFTYEVMDDTELILVLDYYESRQGQLIKFDYDFISVILPLEWGEFLGSSCGENNCLNWETLQEKNTSHFVLEKSIDGLNWEVFGEKIDAQGESNRSTTYQYKDLFIENPRTYYRIKQVDMDQSFDYSETIRVDNMNYIKDILPYPNPTSDWLHLFSKEKIEEVHIISQDHRIKIKANIEEEKEGKYVMNMERYAPNHYMITVITKRGKKTYKIIKK